MDAKQINTTFDLVSYVGAIVSLTDKRTYHAGPCPMCGGRDRFTIKSDGAGARWHCRKCSPDGYHTAIDFFMQYYKLDFKQALERMGGELRRPGPAPARLKPRTPIQVVPDAQWQARALREIILASNCLTDGKAGAAGRQYLTARGISRAAWHMCSLGYGIFCGRPAIAIPYLDIGEVVTAVKYRFIDERSRTDKGARFAMMAGSLPCLFGLQNIMQSDRTLLFVEGELNAVSVLQVLPRGLSVVSAGSDSNGNADILRALAWRYEQVVIWMDDPLKATLHKGHIGRDAKLLQSPIVDGVKWDANEMLKAGMLGDFIERQLSAECLGEQPERALFELEA